jgi:hypothetical protein
LRGCETIELFFPTLWLDLWVKTCSWTAARDSLSGSRGRSMNFSHDIKANIFEHHPRFELGFSISKDLELRIGISSYQPSILHSRFAFFRSKLHGDGVIHLCSSYQGAISCMTYYFALSCHLRLASESRW